MKRTLRFTSLFLALILLLLTLSSCGDNPARDFSNEYNPETDYQFALEFNESGLSCITESPDGYYFRCRNFLYFLDKKTMEAIPLCKKPNCLHDHVSDAYISQGKVTCEAYIGQNGFDGGIFYYDNALYVLSETDEPGYSARPVLQKYAPDGTFLETVYTFPYLPRKLFRHRGYFYYIYEDTSTIIVRDKGQDYGTYRLVQVSLSDKSEKEILSDPLAAGWFEMPIAYGKYIYVYDEGFKTISDFYNDESPLVEQYLIYDTETEETSVMERPETNDHFDFPFLCKDGIMYWYLSSATFAANQDVQYYRSDLSGKNPEEFFVAESGVCKWRWDGTYYYEDNRSEMWEGTGAKRTINVYNEAHELVDTITFEKVDNDPDNVDYSTIRDHIVFASEDYLFFQEGTSNMKLFAVDKKQIGTGNAVPFLVWKSPVQTSE